MYMKIELSESDIKNIILDKIGEMFGDVPFDPVYLKIEVKSKQNYKAEWETASFSAIYERPR